MYPGRAPTPTPARSLRNSSPPDSEANVDHRPQSIGSLRLTLIPTIYQGEAFPRNPCTIYVIADCGLKRPLIDTEVLSLQRMGSLFELT